MIINVLTLFPEMFDSFIGSSILKRAIDDNYLEINFYNFRDYTNNKHKRVDDTSYGGGAGMILSVEPIFNCLKSIENKGRVIALTPTGSVLNDELINNFKNDETITIICGHYEGFDERVYDYCDDLLSIGDYVLTGGETAAFVVIDAITRKIEGVINKESVENDSFSNGILDYPVYTKPIEFDGKVVPDVLLSGNHQLIADFRYKEALRKTLLFREDLIASNIDKIDKNVLNEILIEINKEK